MATRYQGKVADYEVWNEPNYNGFWAPTPDAAQYTALLKIAYTAIKGGRPERHRHRRVGGRGGGNVPADRRSTR